MGLRVRDGAIAGIIGAIVMAIGGMMVGSPPAPDDSTKKVLEFIVDKREALRWQFVLFAVGTILLIWFTAAFCTVMARGDVSLPFVLLPLVATAAILGVGFGGGSEFAALVWRGAAHVDRSSVREAWDANTLAGSFISIAAVVIFLSAAAMIVRTRLL